MRALSTGMRPSLLNSELPFLVTPSATQDAVHVRDSLLLHEQKADFDAQQQKPDFATRDAKLEDSLNKYLPDSKPRKRTSHISQTTPTPKFYLTRGQPTQFWKFWKTFLLGRRTPVKRKSMDGAGDRRAGGKHRRHRPEPLPRETDANGPPQG